MASTTFSTISSVKAFRADGKSLTMRVKRSRFGWMKPVSSKIRDGFDVIQGETDGTLVAPAVVGGNREEFLTSVRGGAFSLRCTSILGASSCL